MKSSKNGCLAPACELLEARRLMSAIYGFHKVADDTTPAPGQSWTMKEFGLPSVSSDGRVAFMADDALSNSGVFTDRTGSLETIAATGQDPAGLGTPLTLAAPAPLISGQNILYGFGSADPSGTYNGEDWIIRDAGGTQSVVYGSDQNVPGMTVNHGAIQDIHPTQLIGSTAVFDVGYFNASANEDLNYYKDQNGTQTTLMAGDLVNPDSSGNAVGDTLTEISDTGSSDGSSVTFRGGVRHVNADQTVTDSNGFYSTAGGLHKILDVSSHLPTGMSLYGGCGIDNGSIAFSASNPNTGYVAIYFMDPNGTLTRLVDTNTTSPTGKNFSGLGDLIGLSGGNLLFSASNGSSGHGLYRSFNGAFSKVIAPGDTLDGRTVLDVAFSPNGINGDNVAMFVQFTQGGPAIYEAPVLRGSDQIVPVEPSTATPSAAIFSAVSSAKWVDAPLASSLTFSVAAGSSFTGISKLPTGYGSAFSVSANGTSLGTFAAGAAVSFTGTSFTVSGINPAAKPAGAKGFPIDLKFSTSKATVAANFATQWSVSGSAFSDTNGNGAKDSTDKIMSGVKVYLDANNNGKLDAGEVVTTTNASGGYMFTGFAAGTLHVREVVPGGYRQTTPGTGAFTINVSSGAKIAGELFGNTTTANIYGNVFNDAHKNGMKDATESSLGGWTVYLDLNNNGKLDTGDISTKTDSKGNYAFVGLPAGTYYLRVMRPSGWVQTSPISNNFGIKDVLTATELLTGQNFGEHFGK